MTLLQGHDESALQEGAQLRADHRSRLAQHTRMRELEAGLWEVIKSPKRQEGEPVTRDKRTELM